MITSFYNVEKREITKIKDTNYVGKHNVDTFKFVFSEEWNGLNKTLKIIVEDKVYDVALVNDEALIPDEAYYSSMFSMGLIGTRVKQDGTFEVVLDTIPFKVSVRKGVYVEGEIPDNMPTPTQWDLWIAEFNRVLEASNTNLEDAQDILEQLEADYTTYIAEFNQIKSDTQQIKEDTQELKEDVEDLKQETADLKDDVQELKETVETEVQEFNTDYIQKKQSFDDDIENFEDDYTEKMAALSTAGTQKVNEVNSAGATQVGNVNAAGNTQVGNVNSAGATQKTAVETAGATQKAAVESAGATQLGNVNTAGSTQASAVNSAGAQQTSAVNSAGGTQVAAVESAGTAQVGSVNQAGTAQVSAIETAGTTQTASVNAAGQQKIDEINSNQTVQQVANHESRLRVLEKKDGRAYSIVRTITDNSSPAWERADDAVGLVANARIGTTEAVHNDFDNIYPWSDIKDCNVDENGEPTHYIGETGFDPTEEVYVHIPKHWIKREQYTETENEVEIKKEKITIFDYEAQGAIEIKEYFIGKYDTAYEGTVPVSKTGKYPANSTARATHRTRARAKGTNFGLLDWRYFDIRLLYLVEYANYNCEAMLGHGNISYARGAAILDETSTNRIILNSVPSGFYVGKSVSIGTDYGNYSVARDREITAIEDYSDGNVTDKKAITFDGVAVNITTGNYIWLSGQKSGQLDSFGNTSGCLVNDNYHCVTYRGIENIWGNVYQHLDGLNIRDKQSYICYDPSEYANDKFVSPYVELGYANATSSDTYIKEVGYDEDNPLIAMPTVTGGSSTTYLCDAYWCSDGDRILLVGGSAGTYGSKCGLFASTCSSASSYSYWNARSSPSYSYQLKRGTGGGQPPENISNIQHSYFYYSNTI